MTGSESQALFFPLLPELGLLKQSLYALFSFNAILAIASSMIPA